MRLLPLLAALLLAGPAVAQREPEWRSAIEQDVLLRPFAYEPETIRLPAGRPVALRFVNQSRSTLAFSAPELFRASRLRPRDRDLATSGGFRLRPGERRRIALVAPAGRYDAQSLFLAQTLLGMEAEIVVE